MQQRDSKIEQLERDELPAIDMFEALFDARGWSFDRVSDEELTVEYKGSWTSYQLRMISRTQDGVVQLIVLPDINAAQARHSVVYEALGLINEQLWLGHFDMWSSNGMVLYRHAVTLPSDGTVDLDQAQTVVDVAIDECERFYPVFQFIIWGGKNARDALEAALVDTYGEA